MTHSRIKRGGVWECDLDKVVYGHVFGSPDTPAIMALEAATIETSVRFIKIQSVNVELQALTLRVTSHARTLTTERQRIKEGSGEMSEEEILTLNDQIASLNRQAQEKRVEIMRLQCVDPAELEPYYAFALDWTLDVEGLPWDEWSEHERLMHLRRLARPALIHYVDTIVGTVKLGHAKKKPSTPTSARSSSTRATATSVSQRRTRKKRKKSGKNTTAR